MQPILTPGRGRSERVLANESSELRAGGKEVSSVSGGEGGREKGRGRHSRLSPGDQLAVRPRSVA